MRGPTTQRGRRLASTRPHPRRPGFVAVSVFAITSGWACMKDNSLGGDTVPPPGGSDAGHPDVGSSGVGGATGTPGSGGSGVLGGTGGSTTSAGTGGSPGGTGGGAGPVGTGGGSGAVGPIVAGGPSKCATTSGVGKLCDGFEGPAPGAAGSVFKFDLGAGSTGVVDTTKAYRGSKSVHMTTNGAQAFIAETMTFAQPGAVATNNELWGRMFIWFATTANPQSHDVFITLEDPASTAQSAQFHVAGGSRGFLASQIRITSDLYHPPMGTGTIKFPLVPPKWSCWEWHTTAANTLEFYVDGALYAPMSVTVADKWPFPIFKSMSLGFMQFTSTPATELWVDEVALDGARIGCDN
jgi:hypothetical protein